MRKQLLTKDSIVKFSRNATNAINILSIIVTNCFMLFFGFIFVVMLRSWFLFILLLFGIVVVDAKMWNDSTALTLHDLNNIEVLEDTLTKVLKVTDTQRMYVWFEDLNKYHDYGWILPTNGYETMKRTKYYLLKDKTSNRIIATYEARLYELDDELKESIVPINSVRIYPNLPKGINIDPLQYELKEFLDSV